MPNRIIRESITASKSMANLSFFENAAFLYLTTKADDFGRFYADPMFLCNTLFPRRSDVTIDMMQDALNAMVRESMIIIYENDDNEFLQIVNWEKYQNIRNKSSRFPALEDEDSTITAISSKLADVYGCNDLQTIDCKSPRYPNLNPNQNQYPKEINLLLSERDAEKEPETEKKEKKRPKSTKDKSISTRTFEQLENAGQDIKDFVDGVSIPLSAGGFFLPLKSDAEQWSKDYPGVDVVRELKSMAGWSRSNPERRKTSKGVRRFIDGWLRRQQDGGRAAKMPVNATRMPYNPFLDKLQADYHDGQKTACGGVVVEGGVF